MSARIRLLVLSCLLLASMTYAMGIRSWVSVVAWSGDGTSVLLSTKAHGPEGGGSLTYTLAGPTGSASFKVSDDFSPGNGTRPQRVSLATCRELLTTLKEQLASRDFNGLAVNTGCEARAGVTILNKPLKTLPPGWKQEMRGEALVLTEGEKVVLDVKHANSVFISPTGRAVVVLWATDGESQLVGVWSREKSGQAFVATKTAAEE